jgi:hypothetical protein
MKRHVLLALVNAAPGREEEFNRWYDQEHLADVLAIPGFVSARRYQAASAQLTGAPAHGYLTLYEIETDDIAAAVAALRSAAGRIALSDAMQTSGGLSVVYTLMTERSA